MMNERIVEIIKNIFSLHEIIDNPTCYIYDLKDICKKIEKMELYAPKNVNLYYAIKANPNKAILNYIRKFDFIKGVEIASSGELQKSLDLYRPYEIIFTGPGKTPLELEMAIQKGIRLINCESIVEAYRISEIAYQNNKIVDILLRINIDYYVEGADEHMAGCSTKMGIDEKDFKKNLEEIKKYSNINIKGIHVFSASGVLDYKYLIKYVNYVFRLVKKLEDEKINIDIIDFGGGIGIDYTKDNFQFDIKNYFNELSKLIKNFGYDKKEIIFELGKYIVGECGYYATKIIDIKNNKNHKHIVTAGGVNHMRLPIATDRKHPVYIINNFEEKFCKYQETVHNEVVDIEGPLCMDEDKISWDEKIHCANIGDIVVLRQSGAYCYSASTLWFLSHDLPKEIIINEKDEISYE